MPPRKVIIDTNFLLIPHSYKIDIFNELDYLIEIHHKYVVSTKTIKELEKIAENKGKTGAGAGLALKIIEARKDKIEIIHSGMPVDEWIEKYAKETGAIVCTNDKALKNKLKESDIKVISLKGRKKLGFV